jgi:hypothetical protein
MVIGAARFVPAIASFDPCIGDLITVKHKAWRIVPSAARWRQDRGRTRGGTQRAAAARLMISQRTATIAIRR